MFVRLVKKKNDRVSVRIVENQWFEGRVKQKVICNFGQLHKDEKKEIQIRMRAAEKTIIEIKNEKNPTFPGFEDIHAPKKRKKRESELKFKKLEDLLKFSRCVFRLNEPPIPSHVSHPPERQRRYSLRVLRRALGSQVRGPLSP